MIIQQPPTRTRVQCVWHQVCAVGMANVPHLHSCARSAAPHPGARGLPSTVTGVVTYLHQGGLVPHQWRPVSLGCWGVLAPCSNMVGSPEAKLRHVRAHPQVQGRPVHIVRV
jgi:hypothetical protein